MTTTEHASQHSTETTSFASPDNLTPAETRLVKSDTTACTARHTSRIVYRTHRHFLACGLWLCMTKLKTCGNCSYRSLPLQPNGMVKPMDTRKPPNKKSPLPKAEDRMLLDHASGDRRGPHEPKRKTQKTRGARRIPPRRKHISDPAGGKREKHT